MAGLWSTRVHNKILEAAFPDLPATLVNALKEGSSDVDSIYNQLSGDPAEHAQRRSGENAAQAQDRYCKFVRENYLLYDKLKNSSNLRVQVLA
jgi:hypothetical protein